MASLEIIDLSSNKFSHNFTAVWEFGANCSSIIMHNNSFESFTWFLGLSKIVNLDLQFNKISRIYIKSVIKKRKDFLFMKVNLEHNYIQLLHFEASHIGDNKRFLLMVGYRFYKCDCDFTYILDLMKYDQRISLNYGNATCDEPFYMRGKRISSIKQEEIMCPVLFSSIQLCDCLTRPGIYFDELRIVVNCTYRNLTTVPPLFEISKTAKVYLMLQNNNIKHLPELQQDLKVISFDASNNIIDNLSLSNLQSGIKFLDLSYNRLTHIDSEVVEVLSEIANISLRGNPWICDCSSIEFFKYAQTQKSSIHDYNLVACVDGRLFKDLDNADICFDRNNFFAIAAVLAGIISLIVSLFYKYQKIIKIWLYTHNLCMRFVSEDDIDEEKIYDAFVVFATPDQSIVEDMILRLEDGSNPYKCCVGVRDWPPGQLLVDLVTNCSP